MTVITQRLQVAGAGKDYAVVVGRGLTSTLAPLLGEEVRKVLLIHTESVRARAERVRDELQGAGIVALSAEIPDAEMGKNIQVASFCWQLLGQHAFTRSDALVSVGGGAVTDLAGFVAATWLRGVRVIHMPTSLIGMVDASVGGKTGINTAEGKNLVGAFHAPAGVLIDLEALATANAHDTASGFAEIIKCGFIADPQLLTLVASASAEQHIAGGSIDELVVRALRVKIGLVASDVYDHGRREMLNYGHTLGHAIEYVERYSWRHGAAVAVGMVFAAELAYALGRIDEGLVALHRKVLTSVGLPTQYRGDAWEALAKAMQRDKKTRGSSWRFVLLAALAQPGIVTDPDPALVFASYREISAEQPEPSAMEPSAVSAWR